MRRVLKTSAILALGLGVSLVASDEIASGVVMQTSTPTNYLQINGGIVDFKHLDKKEGFLDLKYQNLNSNYNFRDILISPTFSLKLSKSYQDLHVSNPIYSFGYIADEHRILLIESGLGYMRLDSQKHKTIHSTDPHIPSIVISEVETQKAPYIALNANAGYMVNEEIFLLSTLNYKVALDRADMKDAYGISLQANYKRWNLSFEHEKFDFKGVDDGENNSLRLGYTFSF